MRAVKRVVIIVLSYTIAFLFGQQTATAVSTYRTESNEVSTSVGSPTSADPSGSAHSCPIPSGTVGCGTYLTPAVFTDSSGGIRLAENYRTPQCGHCGYGYPAKQYCGNAGSRSQTAYGVDLTYGAFENDNAGKPIYLPIIEGKTITWVFLDSGFATYKPPPWNTRDEGVRYAGTYQDNNGNVEKYIISFLHTEPGSSYGNRGKELTSGDRAATICLLCQENHTHTTLYVSGQIVDAANYLCVDNNENSIRDSSRSSP